MRRHLVAAIAIWTLPSLILTGLAWGIYAHFHIAAPPRLGADARAAAMAALRTALEGGAPGARPAHPELERGLADGGPAVVTVWADGQAAIRVEAHGDRVADALHSAAALLVQHPGLAKLDAEARRRARIKVDLVVGRGPLAELHPMLRSMSLHPALEGLGVHLEGGQDVTLLPDDLVDRRLLAAERPIKLIEVSMGLDFERADMVLAGFARLPAGAYGAARRRYYRFKTDSFVERPAEQRDGAPLALVRGMPDGPPLSADSLRAAALAGGRFLVAHLAPNGRYIYEVDLATGKATDPFSPRAPYSLPRHAGTTYFLAELYRITGEEFLREPIERAFGHLAELVERGRCRGTTPAGAEFVCVVDHGGQVANLGSTALSVVALVEYKRATGDGRFDDLTERLGNWLLYMQRPDGTFAHLYHVTLAKKDEQTQLLYFSGEAALALARLHLVTGEERYRDATERALDALVGWYDFFAGRFFFGEEHWTCIAAEAAWPAVKHDRYREFCHAFADFMRRQQPQPGDHPSQTDLVGSYNFTPFAVPHNTPAGSRTEATISTYLLGKYHGRPSEAIRDQVLAAMRYGLRQQIRPDNAWAVHPGAEGLGGVTKSPIDRTVRIDYVQHVCSAMIRSIELLESPG